MTRDKLTSEEADERIEKAKELLHSYLANGQMTDAQNICEDEFGLEPDYLFELM